MAESSCSETDISNSSNESSDTDIDEEDYVYDIQPYRDEPSASETEDNPTLDEEDSDGEGRLFRVGNTDW